MNKFFLVFATLFCYNQLKAQTPVDSVRVAEYRISGITCSGDLPIIKRKLINAEGIDEVNFSPIQMGEVVLHIDYHPALLKEAELKKLIESAPSCDDPRLHPYKAKPLQKR